MTRPSAPLPATMRPRLAALLAVLVGAAIPVQSRLNGALGASLGDPVMAAVLPFTSGLIVLLAIALPVPSVRRGLRTLPSMLARGAFPPYYLAAGTVGAFLVITQTTVVAVIGVAVFTVSVVAGQVLSGLAVDTTGFAQPTRRPAGGPRLAGAVLVLIAVAVSVSPRIGDGPVLVLLAPALLAFAAGLLTGFQHAMNGRIGTVAGSPLVATVTNFVAGLVLLLVLLGVRAVVTPRSWTWPAEWWLYTGGLFGIVFIAGAAALIPHAGVLVVGLGSVAGQLIVSLLLDAVAPVGGARVEVAMVVGTVLALVAIVLTTLPGRR